MIMEMLEEAEVTAVFKKVNMDEVKKADSTSVVGHPDTAAVLSSLLGKIVDFNRVSVKLESGSILYVAQLEGGRLPEGATTLPEGASFKFVRVTIL